MIELDIDFFDTTIEIYVSETREDKPFLKKVLAKKYGYLAICPLNPFTLVVVHIATSELLPIIGNLENLISFCEKCGNNSYFWKSDWNINRHQKEIKELMKSCNLIHGIFSDIAYQGNNNAKN